MSVRIQEEWYERDKVAADNYAVYLFGENYAQQGTDYVPKATQAVIRGLPNAIGIPTKNDPRTGDFSYLTDRQFHVFKDSTMAAIKKAMKSGKTIVIPADGIGTGAAQLSRRAPRCAAFLSGVLNILALASTC
jgi:hypothetical protein